MPVMGLIHQLIVDETGRKDACRQIQLTPEELALFREAGGNEGSYQAVSLPHPCYWFIARETFYSGIERYPGEYMDQVRAARTAEESKRERRRRSNNGSKLRS